VAKPVTGLSVFENNNSNSLVNLDGNFTTIANALNDPASYTNFGTDTGTINNVAVTIANLNMIGYVNGQIFQILIANTNTGVPTLNINALGTKTIFHQDGTSMIAGDLVANNVYTFVYNSTLASAAGGFNQVGAPSASVGSASNVATNSSSANSTFYPTFVAATSGNNPITTNSGLTYNPSTGLLTVTSVSGTSGGLSGTSPALGTNWKIDSNNQLTNNGNTMYMAAIYASGSMVAGAPGTPITYNTIISQVGSNFSLSAGAIVIAAAGQYEVSASFGVGDALVNLGAVFYFGGTASSIIGPNSTTNGSYVFLAGANGANSGYVTLSGFVVTTATNQNVTVLSSVAFSSMNVQQYAQFKIRRIG